MLWATIANCWSVFDDDHAIVSNIAVIRHDIHKKSSEENENIYTAYLAYYHFESSIFSWGVGCGVTGQYSQYSTHTSRWRIIGNLIDFNSIVSMLNFKNNFLGWWFDLLIGYQITIFYWQWTTHLWPGLCDTCNAHLAKKWFHIFMRLHIIFFCVITIFSAFHHHHHH